MAYPLSERPERKKKTEPNNKPFLTAEREAIEEGVAELVQWKPVQQALRTPVIRAIGGGLRIVLQGASEFGEYLKEEARNPPENLLERGPALAGTVLTGVEALTEKTQRGFEMYATGAPIQNPVTKEPLGNLPDLNVDPAVARFAGGAAAETLLGAGVSKAATALKNIPPAAPPMQPAMAMATSAPSITLRGGGINLDFQVMKATTSPEFTGPGMGQGVAKDPKYAGTAESYMENVPTYSDAAAEIERRFAAGEITASRRKNALSKLKKKADAELSTFAYDPENPPVYAESSRTKATKEAQIPDPIAELITEKPAKAHQHHYLAKAQTRPFVDKLLELVNNNVADLDDLVNFFTWPEKYKLFPGNVRSNMADLSPRAHVPSEAVTDFDRKFNVHRMLQDVGLEVKSGTKGGATEFITKNYGLEKVKNADDLMRSWDQFLQEIGIPGKESAKTIQEFFLTEYRKQLTGDKLKQFNEMAAKLYK